MIARAKTLLLADRIRECAESALTRKEAADRLRIPYAIVALYARRFGIGFEHASKGVGVDYDRAEVMASMYQAGRTLNDIGVIYGVTRERVRQIIGKHHGLKGQDGGASVIAAANAAKALRRREARCVSKYGCTLEQRAYAKAQARLLSKGVNRDPIKAYNQQRANSDRCRPRFRNDVAHRSDLKSPTIPG